MHKWENRRQFLLVAFFAAFLPQEAAAEVREENRVAFVSVADSLGWCSVALCCELLLIARRFADDLIWCDHCLLSVDCPPRLLRHNSRLLCDADKRFYWVVRQICDFHRTIDEVSSDRQRSRNVDHRQYYRDDDLKCTHRSLIPISDGFTMFGWVMYSGEEKETVAEPLTNCCRFYCPTMINNRWRMNWKRFYRFRGRASELMKIRSRFALISRTVSANTREK